MQTFEWLAVLVVVAAVRLALGYLLVARKAAKAEAVSEQTQSALAEIQQSLAQQQQETEQLSQAKQAQALEESRLQTRLAHAQSETQRLNDTNQRLTNDVESLRQRSHQAEKELEAARAAFGALKERAQELHQRLQEQQTLYRQEQQKHQALTQEYTELKTTLERKEEYFKEQMQQLGQVRQSLTQEFENLANKIFEEKGKTFTHTSQASINNMLKPFRDQIESFQKRVNEVHDASLQRTTHLNCEIKKVLEIGLQMSAEASNLVSALKGDSQQRGAWGEAQLHRTLEMSGLMEGTHFEAQSAFRDAEGKQKQTDYLIKLPDGNHIIIDSKVTLNAYDRVVSAETPEEYNLALKEHVAAVRRHIDDLASKDYTNLVGVKSPSFVLMFMPIEPAYIEALKHNKDLFEYGYKKNIVLVSHTTLIPILRTVSNLWQIQHASEEAAEISQRAGDIYNSVCTVAERLEGLGKSLTAASNHYNRTVVAVAGQQGLYGKVERFSQLAPNISKKLTQLEPAHMDFETERLTLIGLQNEEVAPPSKDSDQT